MKEGIGIIKLIACLIMAFCALMISEFFYPFSGVVAGALPIILVIVWVHLWLVTKDKRIVGEAKEDEKMYVFMFSAVVLWLLFFWLTQPRVDSALERLERYEELLLLKKGAIAGIPIALAVMVYLRTFRLKQLRKKNECEKFP